MTQGTLWEKYRKAGRCGECGGVIKKKGREVCFHCYKKATNYQQARLDALTAQGRCIRCGLKRELATKRHCEECRDAVRAAAREYMARSREQRVGEGRCANCGRTPLATRTLCQRCGDYKRIYRKARMSPQARERDVQRRAEVNARLREATRAGRRWCACGRWVRKEGEDTCFRCRMPSDYSSRRSADLLAQGRCSRCGAEPLVTGWHCERCAAVQRDRARQRYRERVAAGLCVQCDSPRLKNTCHCQEHREVARLRRQVWLLKRKVGDHEAAREGAT
jgi:hypothetical protein